MNLFNNNSHLGLFKSNPKNQVNHDGGSTADSKGKSPNPKEKYKK